ncbi:hypothetical protein os4_37250 (plasmid) [Comamonadaceae bacterium OS-4]|nr:hypothetical protein os4_37250 [Comamonadaceae bacterium OS-4]
MSLLSTGRWVSDPTQNFADIHNPPCAGFLLGLRLEFNDRLPVTYPTAQGDLLAYAGSGPLWAFNKEYSIMMLTKKFKRLLEIADVKRADGVPNSDEWVVKKLREEKLERLDLLSKIKGDETVVDQALALEADIAAIDRALTAYPELANATQPITVPIACPATVGSLLSINRQGR